MLLFLMEKTSNVCMIRIRKSVKKCLVAWDGSVFGQQVVHHVNRKHSDLQSSLVGVTQPLIFSVHQLIDGPVVHNTIRRNRSIELRDGSSIEQVLVKRLHTFT